jgi:hypothetical protein
MDANLNHGDDMPTDSLSKTDWKDFKELIIGTLIPNFFITYFGNVLPHGDISDHKIKAKLIHLGTGYELWALIAILFKPPKSKQSYHCSIDQKTSVCTQKSSTHPPLPKVFVDLLSKPIGKISRNPLLVR